MHKILEVKGTSYLMALIILHYIAILHVVYLAPRVMDLWIDKIFNIMSLVSMPIYVCQSRLMYVCM